MTKVKLMEKVTLTAEGTVLLRKVTGNYKQLEFMI